MVLVSSIAEPREYCQFGTFNATCGQDEVIVMQTAKYGRMRFGDCLHEDHGHLGCMSDVRPQLDRRCSGRQRCQIPVPAKFLHSLHPCPKELVVYLEASYRCVKGSCLVSSHLY